MSVAEVSNLFHPADLFFSLVSLTHAWWRLSGGNTINHHLTAPPPYMVQGIDESEIP